VSTDAGTSPAGNGRPEGQLPPPSRRGLRDTALGKLVLLAAVLAVALVSARTCGSSQRDIDAEEAVELARAEASFEPCPEVPCVQRRFLQRGIPPRAYWGVVLVEKLDENGRPTRTQSFLVDAVTGVVSRA
jgi:hypothetical protein